MYTLNANELRHELLHIINPRRDSIGNKYLQ